MGLRFDLSVANWIAFVIDERSDIPQFGSASAPTTDAARMALEAFLRQLRRGLMSDEAGERDLGARIDVSLDELWSSGRSPERILGRIREYFRGRAWTALILPGGHGNEAVDDFLCSENLLRTLVDAGSTDRGLLLQLAEPPAASFALTDVFPSFRAALDHRTEWPALLAWNDSREAALFPIPENRHAAIESILWILRHLERDRLRSIRQEYSRAFGVASDRPTTILHISDVHLGSDEANVRLPRLEQHVLDLVDSHKREENVIVALTGDLMDSPDREHLDRVRSFLRFLSQVGAPPIVLLGNHDVRNRGFLKTELRAAFELPTGSAPSGVRWFDEFRLGVVCVNSVVDGHLAAGYVGERQMIDLANALDSKRERDDMTIIGAVHHHPIPVDRPEWYAAPFYERVLGSSFEKTDALEDARSFMEFVREQRLAAVLHGHKHIPRLKKDRSGVPIVGCGSSVGKVATRDGSAYLSLNLLTIDRTQNRLSARLLASRAAGGRLHEQGGHEAVLVSKL